MIAAGQRVLAAGIKLSTMVILGLGGKERTTQHAFNTARVVSAINPTMLSALTLMLHEGTPLRTAADSGAFSPLSPYELLLELKLMMENITVATPASSAATMSPTSCRWRGRCPRTSRNYWRISTRCWSTSKTKRRRPTTTPEPSSNRAVEKGQSALLTLRERSCRTFKRTVFERFLASPSILTFLNSRRNLDLKEGKTLFFLG